MKPVGDTSRWTVVLVKSKWVVFDAAKQEIFSTDAKTGGNPEQVLAMVQGNKVGKSR